jgi:hypothetical protein
VLRIEGETSTEAAADLVLKAIASLPAREQPSAGGQM